MYRRLVANSCTKRKAEDEALQHAIPVLVAKYTGGTLHSLTSLLEVLVFCSHCE